MPSPTIQPSLPIDYERRLSELSALAFAQKSTCFERVGNFDIHLHPSVFSPKFFPATTWFGENLPSIVQGKSFFEVGLGSGLISLYLAAAGSTVAGIDINAQAVEMTEDNFKANGQVGQFQVGDLLDNVNKTYDFIFWNHPWAWDASQPEDQKLDMFFDEDYKMLNRFLAQAKYHLNQKGSVLLGTSYYANWSAMEKMYSDNGYAHEVVRQGLGDLGNGVTEKYYIVQLRIESSSML